MPIDPHRAGRAWITPDGPIVAGSHGTWRLTYEVGAYGYDERARLKVGFRFASDWARPQFADPAAADYTTVRLRGAHADTRVTLAFEPRGGVRPWLKTLVVSVVDGPLHPGDLVEITLGDTSGGGPGARAQTFRERGLEWRVFVDPFGTELYHALDPSPRVDVVGGPLERLTAVAPSTVRAGEPFDALVRAEDRWGNPCERHAGAVALEAEGAPLAGLPPSVSFTDGAPAVRRLTGLRLERPGAETRIVAKAEGGGADPRRIGGQTVPAGEMACAESNPIRALESGQAKTWWADLHGQSGATVGTGTVAEYFAFGRDVALLDAMCHQGNDFQVTAEEWRRVREETARFHEDGRLVVLLGWEWSGMTPAGGDRNVIFRGDDGPLHRTSHAEVEDASDADSDRYPLSELYASLRGRDDVLLVPHVGGRYADVTRFHEPGLEPVVEIFSDWGRFEWLVEQALRAGHTVGIVAGSDGHKGRPGASHPGAADFGAYGGLTCVLAERLTREAIFDALRRRRCYATSAGRRIHVELRVAGLPMGAVGSCAGPVAVTGRVVGTGPLERIDVLRGCERVATLSPYGAGAFAGSERYRVGWGGSRVRGRDRLTRWDGRVELSRGAIVDAARWAIHNPEKGVVSAGPGHVAFSSTTTGDDEGLDLTLDAPGDAALRFRSPVADVDVPLADLVDGRTVDRPVGGVDLHVFARRLPARDLTRELDVDHRDSPPPGRHPYWIRVTQEDGAKAWTSPVYLDTT